MQRINRFPGTDDNGWPDNPVQPCPQGDKLCFLAIAAIGGPPIACCYTPDSCPFYGHNPDMGKNTDTKTPKTGIILVINDIKTKQERLL